MDEYLGRNVVVDVDSPYVYLGRLETIDASTLVLADADIHDMRDSKTTRELYVRDAGIHGIQCNRRRVQVRLDRVISMSLLEDVIA